MTVQELQNLREELRKKIAVTGKSNEQTTNQISDIPGGRLEAIEFYQLSMKMAVSLLKTARMIGDPVLGVVGCSALPEIARLQLELVEKELESRMASSTN